MVREGNAGKNTTKAKRAVSRTKNQTDYVSLHPSCMFYASQYYILADWLVTIFTDIYEYTYIVEENQ